MKHLTAKLNKTNFAFLGSRMFLGFGLALLLGVLVACVETTAELPKVTNTPPIVKPPDIKMTRQAMRSRCNLQRLQASRKFVAEAWAVPDNKFNFGEPLTFQMRVSSHSYATIFHVSTSCKVTRLLHNEPMEAGKIVNFPLRGSGIRITVKPPAGKEAFYMIATRNKLEFLASADILRDQGSGIASLDLSTTQFYERVKQFRDRVNPDDLSITTLKVSILANPN